MNNFLIYACFSRSFDMYHKSNNKIHLISSIVGTLDVPNGEWFTASVRQINWINSSPNTFQYNYIFILYDDLEYNLTVSKIENAWAEYFNARQYSVNTTVVFVKFDLLISCLINTNVEGTIFENIFGKKELTEKDYDSLYQNSVFIFYNMVWSNIVMMFKLCDVNISGGTISKRHILNSVDLRLSIFINELYQGKIPQDIFYRISYKSNFLSNTIPIADYKYYIDKKEDLTKLSLIKFKEHYINGEVNNNEENVFDIKRFFYKNMLLSFNILQNSIIKIYDAKISGIKSKINTLEKDCSILQSENNDLTNIINNNRPSGMSSKEKKRYKEKRNSIINDSNSNLKISKKYNIIKSNLIQIEELKNNLINYENELVKLKNNIDKMSINSLNNIYENLNRDENKTSYKFSKYVTKDNLNKFGNFTRSYSTSSTILTVNSNNDFIDNNNLLISKSILDSTYDSKNCKIEGETSVIENQSSNKINNVLLNIENNSKNSIFKNILDEIIQESNLNSKEKQIKIEKYWVDLMISKIDTIDNKARNSLSYIIKKANETLILLIETKKIKKRFPKCYEKFNKNHLIIAYSILTTFYTKLGFTAIAMKIANDILYDIYSKEWLAFNEINNSYITFNNFLLCKDIKSTQKLNLGSFFIEIFCRKPTYIFDRTYKIASEENINNSDLAILEINEEFFGLINTNFILSPVSLPMLCEPNKWSNNEFGGFLENIYTKEDIITGSRNHKHTMINKNSLFSAINRLNSIKFKINTILLNYLDNDGYFLLEHYFKYKLKDKTDKNQSIISLMIAKSFSKLNEPFYISTSADWRGRIYTNSFYLSYQGGDLSNALLNFYDGMPLDEKGKDYFYIYGANCYNENNLSKKSFKFRIDWVKENYNNIISLNREFILKANNLFLFTSFCLIMKEIDKNPNYKVHLPIFLDATCSGIQHLAALIQDLESAMKVNLIPQTTNDNVGDIYSDLIDPINKAINSFGENNIDYSEFKKIKLNRKHLKLPIMTKIYNVSVIGIAEQLRNSFEKNVSKNKFIFYSVPTENGFIKLTKREIYTLAEIINKQIFISLPSLESIYTYFKDIVRLCLICNIPLTWFTPSGLIITQFYAVSNQNKVSISFKNKTKSIILREVTDNINKIKQVNSIIPNIVHSLDASHLINIINTGLFNSKYPDIITVHDCFGSHPNNIDNLKSLVVSEFVKLYSNENFLKLHRDRIIQSLIDNKFEIFYDINKKQYIKIKKKIYYIPQLPEPGKLDYSNILESQYLIN